MTNARRFQLDELTIRPGSYFNPQTEILIVVDDSPDVDHELFDTDEHDGEDWVLISDEVPIDEDRRDDLVERFQQTYTVGGELPAGDDEGDEDEHTLDADDADDDDEVEELGSGGGPLELGA